MILKKELLSVLNSNVIVKFDCYYPNGTQRSNHNMMVNRIELYDDCIIVYGSGDECETLRGIIEYDDEYECYSITDELGIITYVAAA